MHINFSKIIVYKSAIKVFSYKLNLFEKMDLSNQSKNRVRYLDPLIENGWVAAEFPDEKTHPNQTYVTTSSGERLIKLLKRN